MQHLQKEHENQAKISFGTGDSTINQQEIEKLVNQYETSSTLEQFGIAIAIYGGVLLLGFLFIHEQFRNRKFFWMALVNTLLATLLAGIYFSQTVGYDQVYFSEYTNYYFPIQGLLTTLIAYQLFRFLFKTYFLGEEPKLVGRYEFVSDTPNWIFTVLVFATGMLTGALLNPVERINRLIINFA